MSTQMPGRSEIVVATDGTAFLSHWPSILFFLFGLLTSLDASEGLSNVGIGSLEAGKGGEEFYSRLLPLAKESKVKVSSGIPSAPRLRFLTPMASRSQISVLGI